MDIFFMNTSLKKSGLQLPFFMWLWNKIIQHAYKAPMFAWRGGRGRHYAKSTQGRQNQVGPPGVQNSGYAPVNDSSHEQWNENFAVIPIFRLKLIKPWQFLQMDGIVFKKNSFV